MGISRRKLLVGIGAAVALSATALTIPAVRRLLHPLLLSFRGERTVEHRVREFSAAGQRVREMCEQQGIAFPPRRVVLLSLKQERVLEVYGGPTNGPLRLLTSYPILAASGGPGPKRRRGDRQVPEGVYAVESLNPNSRFHVSLRVGYPGPLDWADAKRDGRTDLGSDIMIHGGAASVGCLAMGDPAIEEIFVLAAEAGIENVTIVLSPVDLRMAEMPQELREIDNDRYAAIRAQLAGLQR